MNPQGVPQQIQLPQVAPGEYQAKLPVANDGVYTLQVTENETNGRQLTQSGGFVVPYSPEYRDLTTNDALLATLASSTGGHAIQGAAEAFTHDLPAVGAARPIWPLLLALLAVVLVADVAVRRVRFSSFEVRAGYAAVRHRLGYVDELPARVPRRAQPSIKPVPLVSASPATKAAEPVREIGTSISQQLLAAKRRAAKR